MRLLAPLLSLALMGCAAHRSVARGDELAAAGDWDAAFHAYADAAVRRPRNDAIALKVEEARVQALSDAIEAATAALYADDLDGAHDAVDRARAVAPDAVELVHLDERVVSIGLLRVDVLQAQGRGDDAYRLGARLAAWYPSDLGAARAVRELRAGIRGDALRLAGAHRYPEAHDRLDLVAAVEPAFDLESWRAEVRVLQADDLVARARAEERAGNVASAYLAAAGALGLAGRSEDRALRDRLRETLVADHGLVIDVDVAGDAVGRRFVEGAVAERVATAAVVIADVPDPDLAFAVSLAPVRFDEAWTTSFAEQPYLAGWDQVPNPAYRDQRAAVDRVEGFVADREADLVVAHRALVAARRTEADAKAALPEPPTPDALAAVTAATAKVDEAVRAVEGCETALVRAREELAAERRALAGLAPYLEVERWDVFRFPVDDVTRTASVAVTVRGPDVTNRATGSASTADAAHPAYPRYGVAEDALSFPRSDAELAAAAWAPAAAEVAALLDAEVRSWRDALVRDALASQGEDAARAWALAALAEPEAPPEGFQRYLDLRWTGVSAGWVR